MVKGKTIPHQLLGCVTSSGFLGFAPLIIS